MTKIDLAIKYHELSGSTVKESLELIDSALELIKSVLERGENLKICGFGNFEIKVKRPRRGRNPQSGESICVAGRRVLTFRPSVRLKQAMNNQVGK